MNSLNNPERDGVFAQPADLHMEEGDKPSVEGLVLTCDDYKDHDGLVTVAQPDRLVKIYARGVQKETSKNRRLVMPFSKVHFNYDPHYSRDFLFLINGHVIDSWWKCSNLLEEQTMSDLLVRMIRRHGITPEIYYDLEQFWKNAHEGKSEDAWLAACKAAVELLKEAGVVMNVDECVMCQRTDQIAGVSMMEGGFVCVDHLGINPLWSKEDLILLRRLVRFPLRRLYKQDLRPHSHALFIYLLDWYEYTTQARLRSLSFLKTLCKERIETGLPLHS